MTHGVAPLGGDAYRISSSASMVRGGGSGAQNVALTDASAFCQKQGRVMVVSDMAHDSRDADVIFRCVAPNNPAAQRAPEFERVPDVTVKMQR